MLGDSGVGKTSLVRRYVLGEFSDTYQTTLGVNCPDLAGSSYP